MLRNIYIIFRFNFSFYVMNTIPLLFVYSKAFKMLSCKCYMWLYQWYSLFFVAPGQSGISKKCLIVHVYVKYDSTIINRWLD